MFIKRRTFIRILSFLIVPLLALGIFALRHSASEQALRTDRENAYARSFADLSAHLNNIETAFEKGKYAAGDYQAAKLAGEIWRETGSAKAALEGLPVFDEELYGVSEFLSRAGDYAYYITARVLRGEAAGENEAASMASLAETAASLAEYVGALRAQGVEDLSLLPDLFAGGVEKDGVSIKEQISEYPELIYDGPFSDHIEKQEALALRDLPEITEEQAREKLAGWFNIPASEISLIGEMPGKLAAYRFAAGEREASVTKKGGMLCSLSCSALSKGGDLPVSDAMNIALTLFEQMGIAGMRMNYYMIEGGEITMNFAYTEAGVTVYPDLIKVTVCCRSGEITGYEATGYLMAHREGRPTAVAVPEEQARQAVGEKLTIVSHNLAVIPTDGKNEVLCHEFVTLTPENTHILVYINAQTGIEEMLQILIETENGTLTV